MVGNRRNGLKEPFNALSHMLGAALSVAGLVSLILLTHGKPRQTIAVTIYGCTLIALYSLSTIYHSLHVSEAHQKILQRMDHVAIFLLISGTYTPICLITLYAAHGVALFIAVWSMALVGILTVLLWHGHPHWIRVALYVIMGWLAVSALPALKAALGTAGIAWLVAGGLAYTLGIVFYAMETRRPKWCRLLTGHEIWHVFVLTGSICHYILIHKFVV